MDCGEKQKYQKEGKLTGMGIGADLQGRKLDGAGLGRKRDQTLLLTA